MAAAGIPAAGTGTAAQAAVPAAGADIPGTAGAGAGTLAVEKPAAEQQTDIQHIQVVPGAADSTNTPAGAAGMARAA